ncbi:hypothetical protein A8H35_23060 [Burkholderia thailandensis]|nr:hypothetical protein WJ27_28640 [Burkholderia thailandensis]AVR07505.1 hypothetical protein A8H31_08470 [Burkholderia thailandensis]AWY62613.1 hypothetical protein A8H35_23060 [Burkholderia thailandensis]AWY66138.1 hypothetical protein A8H36_08205 [Burkholderia thailandensis]KVG17148.1 hypothetical protein WJ25_20825 [Burkholderia thailandensis]
MKRGRKRIASGAPLRHRDRGFARRLRQAAPLFSHLTAIARWMRWTRWNQALNSIRLEWRAVSFD